MTQEISSTLAQMNPVLAQVLGGESTSAPATQSPGATPGAPTTPAPAGGSNIFFFLIIMTVGMLLIMSMSGRKDKKKRAQMLSTLSKRDKVRTAGGIIGTVIEIKSNDEVLIETDRASNTRLLFAKSSITQVLESAKKPRDENETLQTPAESALS